ncbi:MAG: NAD(P)/FAD-dependent oxidoreductase, partial [Candidatus Cloacimonetes bacterium]|nr:NAD(P)/FAD-dependent oxidoreductase [Candidatus Cloacimonadota bacterium]
SQLLNSITAKQRRTIIQSLQNLLFNDIKLDKIDNAIITSGGIDIKNINPKTMESKIIKGLYFAGELIDVDALTGGYNIQIALSTGYTAGISIANKINKEN